MKKLAIAIASGFGAGLIKFGPGTWGTAVASFILAGLSYFQVAHLNYYPLLLAIAFSIVGYWAILQLKQDWVHDDQRIVVDEIIGLFVTVFFVPISWMTIVLSFVLFRFFDIFKPLGIRKFDQIDTHWAVIVDDIAAGVYANITLQIILIFL
jgi:phosphatidylglycerophosphatase A